MLNNIRWCLFWIAVAWSLATGCAATVTAPPPAELACDNYVDTLHCNPSPEWNMPPAFTHPQCVTAFAKLPSAELDCLASMAACSDGAACVK